MNYRLKKEAVPFFKEELATAIMGYDVWTQTYHVEPNALEKVEPAYLRYGFKEKNSSSLCGWSNPETNEDGGSHFHFTIYFPSSKICEHDKFSNGKVVRSLMDKIQNDVNYFYQQFNNKES